MAYPKLYSMRPMEFAFADSETSQETGQESEKALDRNLDTFWQATSTATNDIVLDLNYGTHERIFDSDDRDFTGSSSNWVNTTFTTFVINTGTDVLDIAGDTSDIGYLPAANQEGFVSGETYILTYTYTGTVAGIQFLALDTSQLIGTAVVGTAQTLTFKSTGTSDGVLVLGNAIGMSGTLTDISIRKVGDNASYGIKAVGIWIRNYNTAFGSAHGLKLDWSDDNTNWTEQADKLLDTEMTNTTGTALRFYSWSTASEHRYWRFRFHDVTTITDISQLFLLSEFDVTVSNYFPEAERHTYANIKRRAPGGRLQIEPALGIPLKTFIRNYRFFNDAARDTLVAAFDACRGGAIPLILKEGSDYEVVRIATETLNFAIIDYGVSEIGISFETLPYIADGAVR